MTSANPTNQERLAELRRAIDAGLASGEAGPLDIEAFIAELRQTQAEAPAPPPSSRT